MNDYFINSYFEFANKGTLFNDGYPVKVNDPLIELEGYHNNNIDIIQMDKRSLNKGTMVCGATSYGKTYLITEIIRQMRNSMDKYSMVIIDTKGDYLKKLFQSGDIVLGHKQDNIKEHINDYKIWNLFNDITYEGWEEETIKPICMEIVSKMFEDKENQAQRFFTDASIIYLYSIILDYIRRGEKSLVDRKNMSNKGLLNFFLEYNKEKYVDLISNSEEAGVLRMLLGDTANNQALGVLGQSASQVLKLFVDCFGEEGDFSIREFVSNKNNKCLFIEVNPQYLESQGKMFGILINLILSQVESRNNGDGNIVLVMDELPMLGKVKIGKTLNYGREKNLFAIAGFQSISQLYDIYGENETNVIYAGMINKMIFKVNDNITRNYIRDYFGKNIVSNIRLSVGGCDSRVIEGNVLEDYDLNGLEVGDFIASIDGKNPFKFRLR